MTFPIPSARLFTTDSTAVSGKVDNKANAVVNIAIQKSPEVPAEYKEREVKEETDNPYASGVFVVNSEPEVKEPEKAETKTECFYRTILEAYMENPLIINNCVLMKTKVLEEFIKILTDADACEVGILADVSCCGKPTDYNIVENIVVIKNGTRNDFKVSYNDWYRKLKDFRISLKFTVD